MGERYLSIDQARREGKSVGSFYAFGGCKDPTWAVWRANSSRNNGGTPLSNPSVPCCSVMLGECQGCSYFSLYMMPRDRMNEENDRIVEFPAWRRWRWWKTWLCVRSTKYVHKYSLYSRFWNWCNVRPKSPAPLRYFVACFMHNIGGVFNRRLHDSLPM